MHVFLLMTKPLTICQSPLMTLSVESLVHCFSFSCVYGVHVYTKWNMSFNEFKYVLLSVCPLPQTTVPTSTVNFKPINVASFHRDLSILLFSKLSWNGHYDYKSAIELLVR